VKHHEQLGLFKVFLSVQDVLDPEYYVGCYKAQNGVTGTTDYVFTKYREHVDVDVSDDVNFPTRSEQIFDRY
jgi:hypothetical protein